MTIALYAIADAFIAIAFVHALVWVRDQRTLVHLLFAVTALAGAGFAVSEATFYQADNVAAFNTAFRWTNSFGIAWATGLLWFLGSYTAADLALLTLIVFVVDAVIRLGAARPTTVRCSSCSALRFSSSYSRCTVVSSTPACWRRPISMRRRSCWSCWAGGLPRAAGAVAGRRLAATPRVGARNR